MGTMFAINLAWNSEQKNFVEQYCKWLDVCKIHKIRCVRLFLVPWGIYPYDSSEHLEHLCSIVSYAEKKEIDIILVIDTYVNYCIHTYRDFENDEYGWNSNIFFKGQSIIDFLNESGQSDYLKKVVEILFNIKQYKNVLNIELCNEIDQIEANRNSIVNWINNSIDELTSLFDCRYRFLVSIADYRNYYSFSKNISCQCDIHTYRFPYNTAIENYNFYKKKFPSAWISEFACFSDYAYSETIESKIYFAAMIIGASLTSNSILPASWWWENIMGNPEYMKIFTYASTLDLPLIKKKDIQIRVNEVEHYRKDDKKLREKISYRLAVLRKNPFFLVQEVPAITKFVKKILLPKYRNQYAYNVYSCDSIQYFILLETYVGLQLDLTEMAKFAIANILCIDVIRDQKRIDYTSKDKIILSEGVYWIRVKNA